LDAGKGAGDEQPVFGELLRRHRRAAGLSQEDLARRAGLSVDAIAALERGRRRAPRQLTVRLLAEALGLDPAAQSAFVAASNESAPPLTPRPPPLAPDELVGRAIELSQATAALTGRARLLTMTGPGGIGKTRLAMATAVAAGEALAAPVAWVPLAQVADNEGVAAAAAAALGLRPVDGSAVAGLAEALAGQRLLLVLDNCEHRVGAAAALAAELLGRCPGVRVLATSRELLKVPGEQVLSVPALTVPDDQSPPDRLSRSPAVRLFLRRAGDRGETPDPDQLPAVAAIVRRLDGLPLAIELAAARTNVLTVEQLASELADSFELLADDASTAPARQRTMSDAIGWSHDLLEPADRKAFAALSMFAGGWTLDAAAAVLESRRPAAMSALGRLADRSLIRVRRGPGEARYEMLAVIREYAAEQLRLSGSYDEVAGRHASYMVELVGTADAGLRGPEQSGWLDRLDRELENLRAALTWALGAGEAGLAVRLAGSAWTFCYLRGLYAEGHGWLDRALRLAGGHRDQHVARALLGAGTLSFLQCEYDDAATRLDQALTAYSELGDESGTALTLQRLGSIARERASYADAEALHRQSLDLYSRLGDQSGTAWAHNHLGFVAWLRGDLKTALQECDTARSAFEQLGDGEGTAWSLISLGVVAQYGADLHRAEGLLRESLQLSQQLGYREGVAWSLNQLGVVERRRGRTERAVHLLDESLAEHRDLGDRWRTASVLEELAGVAQQRGRSPYAAFLLGAADAIREQIGAPVPLCEREDRDATLAAVHEAVAPELLTRAWQAGRTAPLHAVVDGYPQVVSGGARASPGRAPMQDF
jgi:predicted ATPase/DNA-binding XRE family transcriptional regulator